MHPTADKIGSMKIYADSLFLLNTMIDYLLLLAAGKICSLPLRRLRMLAGAAFGGFYAVIAAIRPELFAPLTIKLFAATASVFIAFGGMGRFRRAMVAFFGVSVAFGGVVYAGLSFSGQNPVAGAFIPVNMRVLALSFATCYAAISFFFRHMGRRAEKTLVELEADLCGNHVSLTALEDSGNELCDPISGEKVIIIEKAAAEKLVGSSLSGNAADIYMQLSEYENMKGRLRLISFSSLGGEGMLICFRPDRICIAGREEKYLVGIGPEKISAMGEYAAIV